MKRLVTLLLFVPSLAFAAASFDGTNDGYTVDNPNKPDTTSFTVCFWIKVAALPSPDPETIVAYGNGRASTAGRGWDIQLTSSGTFRLNLYDGSTVNNFTTTGTISTGTWYNVCYVRNGIFSNVVYLDNSSIGSASKDPPTAQSATDEFYIAAELPDNDLGYSNIAAEITQVSYWDEALTGTDIGNIADKSTCPTDISPAPEIFVAMTTLPPSDSSINGFTVSALDSPTETSDPSGMPCGAAANSQAFSVLQAMGEQ